MKKIIFTCTVICDNPNGAKAYTLEQLKDCFKSRYKIEIEEPFHVFKVKKSCSYIVSIAFSLINKKLKLPKAKKDCLRAYEEDAGFSSIWSNEEISERVKGDTIL